MKIFTDGNINVTICNNYFRNWHCIILFFKFIASVNINGAYGADITAKIWLDALEKFKFIPKLFIVALFLYVVTPPPGAIYIITGISVTNTAMNEYAESDIGKKAYNLLEKSIDKAIRDLDKDQSKTTRSR